MGNNSKKKAKAGNVIRSKTFTKKKVKVGKVLKKTTVTDSTVKAKSVVLLNQFSDTTAEPVSHRGLTLKDLNTQIGHSGFIFRKDAVVGMKQLLTDNPKVIETSLFDITSSIGRLLTDELFANSKQAAGHLKALFRTIFSVPQKSMATPFHVLRSHLRISLTHIKLPIRKLGLEVLTMAFESFPELCRRAGDLKEGYLSLMQSSKRPNDKTLTEESVKLFRQVYETHTENKNPVEIREWTLSVKAGTLETKRIPGMNRFYFPVFYSESQSESNQTDTSFLDSLT